MDSAERWLRIQEIFHAADEMRPEERDEFIRQACGEDHQLRREVESLLKSHQLDSGMIIDGARSLLHQAIPDPDFENRLFSHYRIISLLGRGGMGWVYLAEDLTLRRRVAIKLLPKIMELDPRRVDRFMEEAYNASRTNHPNMVTIYEIGQDNGQHFIAMELVDGENLRQWLAKSRTAEAGPIPALEIAIQIAAALRAAHRVGVIHQDIKPENVMINREGLVKVLDFGLAKLLDQETRRDSGPEAASSRRPVASGPLGTLEYAAPEQIEKRPVDQRSDIYSFGIVLHELVTGERPQGPQYESVTKGNGRQYPAAVGRIIAKCLQRIPEQRYASVDPLLADLRRALGQVRRQSSTGYRWLRRLAIAIPVILILVTVGFQLYRFMTRFPFRDGAVRVIPIQQPLELATISPDGRYLVYVTHEQSLFSIWLRDLETNNDRKIHPPSPNGYLWPVISPDSRYLYISRVTTLGTNKSGNYLIRINLADGKVDELLAEVESPVGISPDGRSISYISERKEKERSQSSLFIADADGQNKRELRTRETPLFYTLDGPVWSPDGRTIAVTAGTASNPLFYNVVGIDFATGTERSLTNRQWGHVLGVEWMPDSVGMILSGKIRGTVLNHHLFHLDTRTGIDEQFTFDDWDYFGKPGLARVGQGTSRVISLRRQINTSFWYDRAERPFEFESFNNEIPEDGREGIGWGPAGQVLYSSRVGDDENIWITDLASNKRRVTSNPESNRDPVLAPDGRTVVFSSSISGNPRLYRVNIDGSDQRQLTKGLLDKEPEISQDGKWVVYSADNTGKRTIWRVPLAGGPAEQLTTVATESPVISPDGRWIACLYNEDKVPGKVAIFPAEGGRPQRFLILPRPNYPRYQYLRWSPDGQALDYISLKDNAANIWRRPLDGGEAYQLTKFTGSTISDFEWSPDGRRLLCVRSSSRLEVVTVDEK